MNGAHRKTLARALADPVNGNIEWSRIESMPRYRVLAVREFIERIGIQP